MNEDSSCTICSLSLVDISSSKASGAKSGDGHAHGSPETPPKEATHEESPSVLAAAAAANANASANESALAAVDTCESCYGAESATQKCATALSRPRLDERASLRRLADVMDWRALVLATPLEHSSAHSALTLTLTLHTDEDV